MIADPQLQVLHLAHPSPASRLERVGNDGDSSDSPTTLRLLDFFQKVNLDKRSESPCVSSEIMGLPVEYEEVDWVFVEVR